MKRFLLVPALLILTTMSYAQEQQLQPATTTTFATTSSTAERLVPTPTQQAALSRSLEQVQQELPDHVDASTLSMSAEEKEYAWIPS